ncbi:hypothetical protein CL614_00285 [archaeon]|nr:hypothetical protein [archaeon]
MPGQNPRHWNPSDIFEVTCSNCGNEIEFFKDDKSRPCTKCNFMVLNLKLYSSCIKWCAFADECVIGKLDG